MSELDLCSRRQADKLIQQSKVLLNDKPVPPTLGQKVNPNETNISILTGEGIPNTSAENIHTMDHMHLNRGETVILNKPKDYVSGQPDPAHGHIPAVRLLTRDNIYFPPHPHMSELKEVLSNGNHLHFGKRFKDFHDENATSTLLKYAPAGRLDLDSSGLLLFTKNGIVAKHVLNSLEKEYLVKVEPVTSLSRDEQRMGMTMGSLPFPPLWDLGILLKGGKRLWDDTRRLKPLVHAEWVEEGKDESGKWNGRGVLRMVLQEGKKRQIRRMCRELLGLHVVELKRIGIGEVELGDLPVGKWRPLTDEERLSLIPKHKRQ
jgi:23S rRNA pseudouridine2604 synthase